MCRPADLIAPELEAAREQTREISGDIGDILIQALYPTSGMRFLRWKYGLEQPPAETVGKTLEDIHHEDEMIERVRSGSLSLSNCQSE